MQLPDEFSKIRFNPWASKLLPEIVLYLLSRNNTPISFKITLPEIVILFDFSSDIPQI